MRSIIFEVIITCYPVFIVFRHGAHLLRFMEYYSCAYPSCWQVYMETVVLSPKWHPEEQSSREKRKEDLKRMETVTSQYAVNGIINYIYAMSNNPLSLISPIFPISPYSLSHMPPGSLLHPCQQPHIINKHPNHIRIFIHPPIFRILRFDP